MALQTNTQLETHPAGTTNVGGIINGNWQQIEAIFNPALSALNAVYHLVWRAFLRYAGAVPTTAARITWDAAAGKWIIREGLAAIASSAAPNVDFNGAEVQQIATLAHAPTFTFSNLTAGRNVTLILTADGTGRALTFPAVIWTNATPGTLPAGKSAVAVFRSTGTTAGAVFGTYNEQP